MICEILRNGILLIKAQSEIESYALGKWVNENKKDFNNLQFDWTLQDTNYATENKITS